MEKNLSRGLRNNNPGNIRISNEKFSGEVIPSKDPAFKQFATMAEGYRAIFVILGTYLTRSINTIAKIIQAWAPPSENHTDIYADWIARATGINKDAVLTAADGGKYIKIVAAISQYENGVAAKQTDVIAGFNLQTKIHY